MITSSFNRKVDVIYLSWTFLSLKKFYCHSQDIHPGQLAVCRFVGIFVLTIPLIVYHDLNPFGPPELRHLLILRGLAGATSLFLRFVAFHYLPIADASVIIFSIPVFVSIFAWIFLKVIIWFNEVLCFFHVNFCYKGTMRIISIVYNCNCHDWPNDDYKVTIFIWWWFYASFPIKFILYVQQIVGQLYANIIVIRK